MLKTWAAAIWPVQIILQQNAVALIRIYNENFVWQLILSWYLSIRSYRSNHCSKEMYSGRAGCWLLLSAWHGADCKEFPEEVVDEVCEGSAGAGAGLGQGDNHLCRVSPLLSSCCNSLFSTSPQLRVTSLSPTPCTAQLLGDLVNTK